MGLNDFKLKFVIDGDARTAEQALNSVLGKVNKIGGDMTAAFGGAIPIAGAVAGAIGGIGVALFAATKQASEYGSMIHDASDKTGLHAETLSAMDAALKQSDTSMEQLTGGIAKYSKTVGAAAEDTKKATAFVKDFGIAPQEALNDLEGSLGKVFKRIVEARSGVEQMTLAQKAFGRSGADLLPFIKQFDGDLPGLIAKMKELGVTISDKDAAAADEFGDQMAILDRQLHMVSVTIGGELMDTFTHFANDLSSWLSQNKGEVKSWGQEISRQLRLFILDMRTAVNIWRFAKEFVKGPFFADEGQLQKVNEEYNKIQKDYEYIMSGDQGPDIGTPYGPGGRRGSGGSDSDKSGGAGKKAKAAAIGAAAPSKRAVEVLKNVISPSKFDEAMHLAAAQVAKETGVDEDIVFTLLKATLFRESSGIPGQTSSAGAKGLTQQLPGTAKRLGPGNEFVRSARYLVRGFGGEGYQAGGAPEAFATYFAGGGGGGRGSKTAAYVRDQTFVFNRAKEILGGLKKVHDEEEKLSDESIKNAEEAADRRIEIGQTWVESLIALEEHAFETELELSNPQAAGEAAQNLHDLKLRLIDDEITALEQKAAAAKTGSVEEREAVDAVTLARIKADLAIKQADWDLEQQRKKIFENEQKRWADWNDTVADAMQSSKEATDTFLEGQERIANLLDPETEALQNFGDAWEELRARMEDAGGSITDTFANIGTMGLQFLDNMGQALGSSIEAWALYGDSIGQSLKKALAAELAHIAGIATIKAIYSTALGFLLLAEQDYPGAAFAFGSAVLWASIAGGSAIGAKLIGGGKKKAASTSAGGYSGSANRTSSQDLSPYSRTSADAFISGRRPDPAVQQLANEVKALHEKLGSMSPGDVLVRGTQQKRGHIATTLNSELGSNGGHVSTLNRRLGAR